MSVDLIPDVDLEAWLSVELPPCHCGDIPDGVSLHEGPACGAVSVSILRTRCSSCGEGRVFGICARHLATVTKLLSQPRTTVTCRSCGDTPTAEVVSL